MSLERLWSGDGCAHVAAAELVELQRIGKHAAEISLPRSGELSGTASTGQGGWQVRVVATLLADDALVYPPREGGKLLEVVLPVSPLVLHWTIMRCRLPEAREGVVVTHSRG